MKVKVTIEETLRKDFEVEVPNIAKYPMELAMVDAKEKYIDGEFILDGDAYVAKRRIKSELNDKYTEWQDFIPVKQLTFEESLGKFIAKIIDQVKTNANSKGEKNAVYILRKREMLRMINEIEVGDQINLKLSGLGEFTATAQKVGPEGALFMFDDCVARHCMNETYTNKGSYEKSEMYKWINTTLAKELKEEFGPMFVDVSLPTYGQMFGHDEWYEKNLEPDNNEQFPLMKKRKNRVADFEDDYCWYWLKNATKKSVSSEGFASVNDGGGASSNSADGGCGVRPVFLIKHCEN